MILKLLVLLYGFSLLAGIFMFVLEINDKKRLALFAAKTTIALMIGTICVTIILLLDQL